MNWTRLYIKEEQQTRFFFGISKELFLLWRLFF